MTRVLFCLVGQHEYELAYGQHDWLGSMSLIQSPWVVCSTLPRVIRAWWMCVQHHHHDHHYYNHVTRLFGRFIAQKQQVHPRCQEGTPGDPESKTKSKTSCAVQARRFRHAQHCLEVLAALSLDISSVGATVGIIMTFACWGQHRGHRHCTAWHL